MTTRRFSGRAGASYRRGGFQASAGVTYVTTKPLIQALIPTAANSNRLVDITADFETDLGNTAMGRLTYLKASGYLQITNFQDVEYMDRLPVGFGFYVGPQAIDPTDVPNMFTDPDRFMWSESRIVSMFPIHNVVNSRLTIELTGGTTIPEQAIWRPKFNFRRRPKPGDHLFLVYRVGQNAAGTALETAVQVNGEVRVLAAVR